MGHATASCCCSLHNGNVSLVCSPLPVRFRELQPPPCSLAMLSPALFPIAAPCTPRHTLAFMSQAECVRGPAATLCSFEAMLHHHAVCEQLFIHRMLQQQRKHTFEQQRAVGRNGCDCIQSASRYFHLKPLFEGSARFLLAIFSHKCLC